MEATKTSNHSFQVVDAQFMKRHPIYLIALIVLLLGSFKANASHIIGGEIYYDSLGNNKYRVTIEIYRDCNSLTDYDQPLNYTVFYANGTIWSQFAINIQSRDTLPIVYNDPCVTPPDDICVERAIYVDTIILPFDIDGYYISYQRCCWANNIDNIVDPTNNGITLTTFIPGSMLVDVHNQGARFINYPPLVLCSNNPLIFDHAAFDPDGDSLAYSLVSPLLGGSITTVIPDPETAAPYTPVSWNPTYNELIPFGTGSSVTIDPQTGMMVFTPNLIGNYVAGVEVREYRDGLLINSKIRTYGYRVVGCQVEVPLTVQVTGPTELVEGCGFAGFIVSRTDTTEAIEVQVLLSGTATNGQDYPFIPDSLLIPTGVFSDTIGISAIYDGLTEGDETVHFNIIIENPCDGTYDTTSISLILKDYIALEITAPDSINICSDQGQNALLSCSVVNGAPPYSYDWEPGFFLSNDSITLLGNQLEPNLNVYYVTATDQCNHSIVSNLIRVYNQCPLSAPNVLTLNNDGINDIFTLKNWEDFDKIAVTIVNRWGNCIYESADYQNDWNGKDQSGNSVSDGVYFYTVTPSSEKFTYDDAQKSRYTIHGFLQIYHD